MSAVKTWMVPAARRNPVSPGIAPPGGFVDLPEASGESQEFASFAGILEMLWRRRGTMALFVAGGVVLAAALALTQPKTYHARTLVEVQTLNEDYLNRRQLDPTADGGGYMMEPYLQTQIRLLQSDTLLWQVAERIELAKHAEFRGDGSAPGKEAMLREIHSRLSVKLLGTTRILEIGFESREPKLSADFVNALAAGFIAQMLERRVSATRNTAQSLAGELGEMKASFEKSEQNLREYLAANGLMMEPEKDSIAEARLRSLQSALSEAQNARVTEQSRQMTQPSSVEAMSELLDNDTLRAYRVRLTELNQKLAEASELYKPAHYRVRQVRAELDQVQKAYHRERSAAMKRMSSGYESARLRERMLREAYDRQSGVVATQVSKSIRYNTLKREVETSRQLYEATLQKVKEASLASAIHVNNVHVVDRAEAPDRPVKPSKPLYAALGLCSGGFFGALLVLFQERNNRWQSTGQARLRLSIPELGTIPSAAVDLPHTVDRRAGARKRLGPAGSGDTSVVLRNWLELIAWRHPDSTMAEAYRGVLASLLFSSRSFSDGAGDRPRIIVVTSAGAGEGRSTVTCNLGIAMAEAGRHVLLIDADRRNPRLHEIFDVPCEPGFTELVRQPGSYHDNDRATMSLAEAVHQTRIPGLYVLPAGGTGSRQASLVDNPRAAELLDLFRAEFDAVLIDTPPVLSHTDARGLARQADGVAMVIRAKQTPLDRASIALARLTEDGVYVLGTILNDFDPEGRLLHRAQRSLRPCALPR